MDDEIKVPSVHHLYPGALNSEALLCSQSMDMEGVRKQPWRSPSSSKVSVVLKVLFEASATSRNGLWRLPRYLSIRKKGFQYWDGSLFLTTLPAIKGMNYKAANL